MEARQNVCAVCARADLLVDPRNLTGFVDEHAHAGGQLFLGANRAELEAQLAVGVGQKRNSCLTVTRLNFHFPAQKRA